MGMDKELQEVESLQTEFCGVIFVNRMWNS